MKILYGLGNPGKEYHNNKHNIGKLFIEWFRQEMQLSVSTFSTFQYSEFENWILADSLLYMNESGKSIREYLEYMKLRNIELILLHDDSDQFLGKAKFVVGGGSAGHRGVESVYRELIRHVSPSHIMRLKIGIRPHNNVQKSEHFVLSNFSNADVEKLHDLYSLFFGKHNRKDMHADRTDLVMTRINSWKSK